MCHFITAVLPASAPVAELDQLARKHRRQLRPLTNPSMARQLRRDQRYFLTTLGHCDCGTALGSQNSQRKREPPDWAAEEQRLLKKGWSKTKAVRALAQRRESEARPDKPAVAKKRGVELASWTSLITEVLATGTDEFGLLLHFYNGPLDEDIQLKGIELIAAARDEMHELLIRMEDDVLYVFRSGR